MTDFWADYNAKNVALRKRFERIAQGGQFDAILPKPKVGLLLVGGPRNRHAAIPAETKDGLHAAFRAILRAERRMTGSAT